ncbi:BTB/POZ domain-containing protein [Aspergillus mulundensis]|uniref:BTB domain-containing protein n=1 Tax=Aspergillus mulundensis TaxID=1810919 RepID=A0A3D8T2P5_9EURO|nr:hypothetical protein DSM5745_00111 [Aspergillus mulundensis]RDW92789.1 hypothetical protein DSM5745_00111 [Aspergillus mulundensis]
MLGDWVIRARERARGMYVMRLAYLLTSVGEQRKTFVVHEAALREFSPFFDKALTGEWKEARERVVQLPEEDPEVFDIFVHWVYCGKLPFSIDEHTGDIDAEYMELAKAYVFGEKLLSPEFQDRVVDVVVEKSRADRNHRHWMESCLGMDVVRYVYGHTLEGTPLRKLVVDIFFEYGDKTWLDGEIDVPQPFTRALAMHHLAGRVWDENWVYSSFRYYSAGEFSEF